MSEEVTSTPTTDAKSRARPVPPPALPPKPRRIPVFTPSGLPRPPDHLNEHRVTTIPEETRSELEASVESLTSPSKEVANGHVFPPRADEKPHYEPLTKKNVNASPQKKSSPSKSLSKSGLPKFFKKPSPAELELTASPGSDKSSEISESTHFEFCRGKLKSPPTKSESKLPSPVKKVKSPSKLLKPKNKSSKYKSGSDKCFSDSELKSPGDSDTSGSPDKTVSKSAPVSPIHNLPSNNTSGGKIEKQSLLESKFRRRSLKSRGKKSEGSNSSNQKEDSNQSNVIKPVDKSNANDKPSLHKKPSKVASQSVEVVDLKGTHDKHPAQGGTSCTGSPSSSEQHALNVPLHRGPGSLSAHSQALSRKVSKAPTALSIPSKPPVDVAPKVPPKRDISPSEPPRSSSGVVPRKRPLSPPALSSNQCAVKLDTHSRPDFKDFGKRNLVTFQSAGLAQKKCEPNTVPQLPPRRSTSPPGVPPRLGSLPPVPSESDSSPGNILSSPSVESKLTNFSSSHSEGKPRVPSYQSQHISPIPNTIYCELALRRKSSRDSVCGRSECLEVVSQRDTTLNHQRPGSSASRHSRSVSPSEKSIKQGGSMLSMDTWRGRSVSPCGDQGSWRSSSSLESQQNRAVSPSQQSSSSSTGSASSVVCRKAREVACDHPGGCRGGTVKGKSDQPSGGNWVLLVDRGEKGIVPVKPGQPLLDSTMQEPPCKSSGKPAKPTSRLVAMKNKLKQSQKKKSEKELAKKAEKEHGKKGKENLQKFSSHSKHLPDCHVGQCNGHIQAINDNGCMHTRQPRPMTRSLTDENICFSKPDIVEADRRVRSRTTEVQLDDLPPCIQERALDIGKQRHGYNYFVVRHRADCRLATSASVGIATGSHQPLHPPMKKGENKSMPQLRDPRTRPSPDQLRRILGFTTENNCDGFGDSVSMPSLMKRSHTFQGQVDVDHIPEETAWAETVRRTRAHRGQTTKVAVDGKSCGLRVSEAWQTTPREGGGGDASGCNRKALPPTPRRHTVTVGGMDLEYTPQKNKGFDRQRDAFLTHLAQRFPAHADTIKTKDGPLYCTIDSGPKRQALVAAVRDTVLGGWRGFMGRLGHPKKTGAAPDKDASPAPGHGLDTLPDGLPDEGGGFKRGGTLRSSLPVVRSPNKTLEKPLGLVYLIFRNETKRALLPNEITTMDTVRALFVRSFPDVLSMPYLDGPSRKIYIMDAETHLYYELEDFKDVKDRCVLKIYEPDQPLLPGPQNGLSRSPSMSPKIGHAPRCNYNSGHESDTSVRSAPTLTAPQSPGHHRAFTTDFSSKTQSLPVQSNYVYQQQMATYGTLKEPTYGTLQEPTYGTLQEPVYGTMGGSYQEGSSFPPAPVQQFTSSPPHLPVQYRPQPGSNQGSPVRAPHGFAQPQRHSVAYLPESTTGFPTNQLPQSRSYHDYYDGSRSGSATPTHEDAETRSRMMKMEAQLASLTALVQTAVIRDQPPGGGSRPGSARSESSVTSDNSAKSKSPSGSTTPVICSPSSQPGLSELSSATTPQPMSTMNLQNSLYALQYQARQLKDDCRGIRRQQVAFQDAMRETINDTLRRIKEVLPGVPGAEDLPIRAQRLKTDSNVQDYKVDAGTIECDLKDLESSVDELRSDVLNKRCRVNMNEVESMALALSNISKNVAELKHHFPDLQDDMKTVMAGEMKVVVDEEKFLREEPARLDESLKRCKKLAGTLFTLKRLANVQSTQPPASVSLPTSTEGVPEPHQAVLQDIQAMIPDHQARLSSLQAADESRERKKKLVVNQDALRFEKSLELAQKQIKDRAEEKQKMEGGEKEKMVDTKVNKVEITLRLDSVEKRDGVLETKINGDPPPPPPTAPPMLDPGSPEQGSVADKIQALESPPPLESSSKEVEADKTNLLAAGTVRKLSLSAVKEEVVLGNGVVMDGSEVELVETKAVVQSGPIRAPPAHKEAAPPKPPRHNERELENVDGTIKYKAAVISVKTTGNPAATVAAANESSVDGTALSTFTKPSPQPSPNPQHHSPTKISMPTPTSTSTPIAPVKNHVTFSNTVTEIIDSSAWLQEEALNGKKKIPPPPPPRRSSRPSESTPDNRPFSPPAYENIENFPAADDSDANDNRNSKLPQLRPPPNGFGSRRDMAERTKHYSMNVYQMQMAEGIYANMGEIREVPITDSDSDSRSSQQRKMRPDSYPAGKETVGLRDGKKVPPPPPVRRTSALTNAQKSALAEDENKNAPMANGEVKNEIITTTDSVQDIVSRFNTNTSTTNPKTIHGRAVNKKYEETEIY